MEHNVFNSTSFAVVMLNSVCNLKCKHCGTFTPYRANPRNYPLGELKADISRYFEIFYDADYEHFDFIGGEPLLHTDLPELTHWIMTKHINRFRQLRILTNGSIKISEKLIKVCKDANVYFLIDDYGKELSPAAEYNCAICKEHNIAFSHRIYYGDEQYYNGWIDFGMLEYKNYTKQQTAQIASGCKELICGENVQNGNVRVDLHIQNGRIYACDMQLAEAKHIDLPSDEYVDLRSDEDISIIREKLRDFKRKPLECCKYCNGFSNTAERVPAAIQLSREELAAARNLFSSLERTK
jgi:MoaA/NifB/PqqE/SkfB family radical SAM enzyme